MGLLSIFVAHALFAFHSDNDPATAALIGFGLGIFLFVKGFKELQLKRLIMDTPTAKVRSAAIGLVELQGLAIGPHTIKSPVQHKDCFYYRAELYRWEQRGKNSEWVKKADERLHVPFYLKDNTGMQLIDPTGAELDLHKDYEQESGGLFGSGAPPGVMAFIERHGQSRSSKLKIVEYTLQPEHPTFILGTLATNPGVRPMTAAVGDGLSGRLAGALGGLALGSGGASGMLLNLVANSVSTSGMDVQVKKDVVTTSVMSQPAASGAAQAPAVAETLKPGDPRATAAVAAIAQHDPALAAKVAASLNVPYSAAGGAASVPVNVNTHVEWKGINPGDPRVGAIVTAIAAKNPALAAVIADHLKVALPGSGSSDTPQPAPEGSAWPEHDPTVIMKGTHDKHYYISWRSQKEVLSSLSRQSFFMIWGGPILTLVCAWYLLGRMGLR